MLLFIKKNVWDLLAVFLLLGFSLPLSQACPLCGAVAPTFVDNIAEATDVVTAFPVPGQVTPLSTSLGAKCQLRVRHLLKGKTAVDSIIEVPLVDNLDEKTCYLVLALPKQEEDPESPVVWSYTIQLSSDAERYVLGLVKFDPKDTERIPYYLRFLTATDKLIKEDAHGELAKTSYAELVAMRSAYDRQSFREKLLDEEISPQHQRLYWMLLGICGRAEDAALFDTMLARRNSDSAFELGTDAAIACYLSLGGADALKRIDQEFIHNRDGDPSDATAAVQAIRFHATEVTSIPREEVKVVLRRILKRRDLADFIIPDLARLQDWSALQLIFDAFKVDDEAKLLVRIPAVNYLRVCPLPEAKAKLEECRQIDPSAVRRAEMLYRFSESDGK